MYLGHSEGGSQNSANNFYLAFDANGPVDRKAVERNKETWAVCWASYEEAVKLLSKTTDTGRERDLKTLAAAYVEYDRITRGNA